MLKEEEEGKKKERGQVGRQGEVVDSLNDLLRESAALKRSPASALRNTVGN